VAADRGDRHRRRLDAATDFHDDMMPRILDRYVFRVVGSRVFYTFVMIVMLYLVLEMVERGDRYLQYMSVADQPLPRSIADVLVYAALRLLPALVQFGSIATLIGVIFSAAQMSSHNEFVAIRAAGVRLSRAMAPAFVVALLVSVFSFFLANFVLPDLTLRGEELEDTIMLRQGRRNYKPLAVQQVQRTDEGQRQVALFVGQYMPDRQMALDFVAVVQQGQGYYTVRADAAQWRGDGWYFMRPPAATIEAGEDVKPYGQLFNYAQSPSQAAIGRRQEHLKTTLSPALLLSKRLGPDVLRLRDMDLDNPRLAVAFHRRIAGLLSGLVILGLGLPFILGAPFSNPWTNRAIAVGLAAAYLSLSALAAHFGGAPNSNRWIAALAVWAVEIAFFAVAFYLLQYRMDRT
jgi:lipopolysaccharide export LptBFGC system permease protein LptF